MRRPLLAPALGEVFGRLTVAGAPYPVEGTGRYLTVSCECGAVLNVKLSKLLSGHTKSCGCWKRDVSAERATVHGGRHLPEYQIWLAMRQRCTNPRNRSYVNYGGRGITVCRRWDKFENFLADMGPRPFEGATIERKNNDKGYSPSNCIWATRLEQARNTRRTRKVKDSQP